MSTWTNHAQLPICFRDVSEGGLNFTPRVTSLFAPPVSLPDVDHGPLADLQVLWEFPDSPDAWECADGWDSSWERPHLSSQLPTSVRKRLCSSTSQQQRPHASQLSGRRSNKSNVNTWYMTSFWTCKQYISIQDNLGNTLTIQRRKELSDLIATPRWKPLLPFW